MLTAWPADDERHIPAWTNTCLTLDDNVRIVSQEEGDHNDR